MSKRNRLLSNKQQNYLETGGAPVLSTHHLLQFSSDHSVPTVGGKNAAITLNKGTRVIKALDK
jgi:hypothetical protein